MYLRHESRATFDTCTYPAGIWISNVLGFATDDTVISPFGVAIPFSLPLPVIRPDFSSFHMCRSSTCEIDFTGDAYIGIIAHRPEGSLNLHSANSVPI